MRSLAVFTMFFLALPIHAQEKTGDEQASQPKAQGMIYATVKVAEDSKAEFLDGPNSELPGDIVAKISPALMKKARDTHAATPSEDGVYRVAVDWKVVSINGQDQMKFEYSNSEPYPLQKVDPVYTRNGTAPVEIVYRIGVAADGSVTDVDRTAESAASPDLYRAGRKALKLWMFSPQYKDGVAVAGDVDFPLVFDLTEDIEAHGPAMHGL